MLIHDDHLSKFLGPREWRRDGLLLHRCTPALTCLVTCLGGRRELLTFCERDEHWEPCSAMLRDLHGRPEILWDCPTSPLEAAMLLPPPLPEGFTPGLVDGRLVELGWVYPIHPRELQWARDHGLRSLLVRLGHLDMPISVDPARLSVV